MGICGSTEKKSNQSAGLQRENKYRDTMRQQNTGAKRQVSSQNFGSNQSFNPIRYDHVIANRGSVEKEYRLITPPLGQGAFGEVRKAIHLNTGLERAVKIIYKDKSDPVELAKIKDEVRKKLKIETENFGFTYRIYR